MEQAFKLMYERLADFMMKNRDFDKASVILEAGCGMGQLTIPLVNRLRNIKESFKIIAFDISAVPYEGDLEILRKRIMKEKLKEFITPMKGNVRNMKAIDDANVDLIVSNELFCELNRNGLEQALKEFYRILKPNGQMAHGELSPIPENEAQKLVVQANAHSLETMEPKLEWFSPYSDEIAVLMHKIGFKNLVVKYFETNLKMDFDTAIRKLGEWKTDPVFIEEHLNDLQRYGLEYPIEHVIFCEK
ncbi:MAG: class I SAM-dependent methyltransferase [Candidatus Bathyarchaeota archaeon]|nr:class I SAM-dependent methyltransferase [Candidatus Bathyarchaeota archaeon]